MSRRSNRIASAIRAPSASIGLATTTSTTTASAVANRVPKTKRAERSKRDDKESNDDDTTTTTAPKKKQKGTTREEPPLLSDGKSRCNWANNPRYPLLQAYHDEEWNHPTGFDHTNRYLFELLILEGAQAGLSWSTVLHKREAYREAYHQFDYHLIATTYSTPADNERLLQTNIVKNRLKVQASMSNAKAFCELLEELYPDQTGLDDKKGFWMFLQDYKKKTKSAGKKEPTEYLTTSAESDQLSAYLKKRGFKFVGSTIMYSYLQAAGIEQDGIQHTTECFRHKN